jgi:hypothetical protein
LPPILSLWLGHEVLGGFRDISRIFHKGIPDSDFSTCHLAREGEASRYNMSNFWGEVPKKFENFKKICL